MEPTPGKAVLINIPSACIRYLSHVHGIPAWVGPGGVTVAQVGEALVVVVGLVVVVAVALAEAVDCVGEVTPMQ
jgi:hypothetical protein